MDHMKPPPADISRARIGHGHREPVATPHRTAIAASSAHRRRLCAGELSCQPPWPVSGGDGMNRIGGGGV